MAEDLITALVWDPGRVEWTTLRRRKGQIEVVQHRHQALEGDVNQTLKPLLAGVKGRISIALPTAQVLLRVVKLPTTDLAELREMAALQVDKFSPFPVEQMAVSQEVLSQQGGASYVLIAAALQEQVDRMGETLRAAGRFAREVDVSVLGWWRLLKLANRVPEQGRHLLLIAEERGLELIVVQDGSPVIMRSLGALGSDLSATAQEVAEEINYTLTTLEAEWGLLAPGVLQVWHRRAQGPALVDALRAQVDAEVQACVLEDLPPLSEGLARRALERGPHLIDLAPAEWKATLASRRLQRTLLLASGVFVALWLAGVGGLALGLHLQKKKLAEARQALADLREPAREVEQLKEQVRSLERYLDPTYSALECLREISSRLPPGVELTALTYKKYGQIALRGEADSSDPIYDFFQSLEKTELFPAVKPEGVTQQQRGGRAKSQFKLTIELPGEVKK